MTIPDQRSRGTFLALLALDDGPKHGYDIARYLEEKTNGFFSLSFGALYPILHRLERDGLISGDWEEVGAAHRGTEKKKKKVYALTAKGRKELKEERAHHEALSEAFARLLATR
jgi:PadR family transcriptional regulator, regulatory protein PadR